MTISERPLTKYESVRRWERWLKRETVRHYEPWLGLFLDRIGLTPDELVTKWRKATDENDEDTIEEIEDEVREWFEYLVKTGHYERSAATMVSSVQSFMANRRCKLGKLRLNAGTQKDNPVSIPTREELRHMIDYYDDPVRKFLIAGLASSGLSVGDFLSLRWDNEKLSQYGTVGEQLREDPLGGLVHVHGRRHKTNEGYETFLGSFAVDILRQLPGERRGRIVRFRIREAERTVTNAGRKGAHLRGRISPAILRTYFSTTLKGLKDKDADVGGLCEMFMGHSLGTMKEAYETVAKYRDNVLAQAQKYKEYEKALAPV